jgi:hypothetical protein
MNDKHKIHEYTVEEPDHFHNFIEDVIVWREPKTN